MTAPQTLVQAALSRLAARLGSGAVDTAATVALLVQDAPEKLRQELHLFWEEVRQEADRLERGTPDQATETEPSTAPAASAQSGGATSGGRHGQAVEEPDVQALIDGLRAQVARLSRGPEQRP